MAEKKEKKYVAASEDSRKNRETTRTVSEETTRKVKEAQPVGNPTPLRLGAVALWVLALVFEILALLVFVAMFLWAFAASSVLRVWLVLAGGGAAMIGAGMALQRMILG